MTKAFKGGLLSWGNIMDEEKMDIVEHNKDAWNVVSENNEERTNKVTESIISDAKKVNGMWC